MHQRLDNATFFLCLPLQNAYFPLFITEDVLNTEKDHVEGFAPEVSACSPAGWVLLQGQAVWQCSQVTGGGCQCQLQCQLVFLSLVGTGPCMVQS
jgi:hypothetical protein